MRKKSLPNPEWLTVEQVAAETSAHRNTVLRWIDKGYLPAYRFGPRVIRINRADLDAMIQESRLPRRAS